LATAFIQFDRRHVERRGWVAEDVQREEALPSKKPIAARHWIALGLSAAIAIITRSGSCIRERLPGT